LSKCLKCGAPLPPVGDCPTCADASAQPTVRNVPSLLDKELHLDRRRGPERATPPAGLPSAPPGMLARAPTAPRPPAPAAAPGVPARPSASMPAAPGARPAPAAPAPAPWAAGPSPQPAMAAPPRAPAPRPPAPATAEAPTLRGAPSSAAHAVARTSTAIFGAVSDPRQSPGLPAPAPRAAVPAGLPTSVRPAAPPPAPEVEDFEDDNLSVDIEEEPLPPPRQVAPERAAPPRASLPVMPPRAPARAPAPTPAPVAALAADGVTEIHARPASLWRRLLSFAIDAGAIAGVASLYLLLASSVVGVEAPKTGLAGAEALAAQARALESILVPGLVLVLVLALVYCAIAAVLWNGRTLGRRLLGLRLVDTHGLSPAPGRAVVRALLATLSFGLFLAGFWMALFDRRGQTLHDKLTSTFVVQPS
jgi:resuscitation-promoting factor RpfA